MRTYIYNDSQRIDCTIKYLPPTYIEINLSYNFVMPYDINILLKEAIEHKFKDTVVDAMVHHTYGIFELSDISFSLEKETDALYPNINRNTVFSNVSFNTRLVELVVTASEYRNYISHIKDYVNSLPVVLNYHEYHHAFEAKTHEYYYILESDIRHNSYYISKIINEIKYSKKRYEIIKKLNTIFNSDFQTFKKELEEEINNFILETTL